MAYISPAQPIKTVLSTNSTTFTPNIPKHAAGELIVIGVVSNPGTAAISISSGWIVLSSAVSDGSRSTIGYKVAATNSEVRPTFTGTSGPWCGIAFVLRDVNVNNIINSSARYDWSSANPQSPILTTTENNCFVLYMIGCWGGSSGANYQINISPTDLVSIDKENTSGNSTIVMGYINQLVAGSVPRVTFRTDTDGGNIHVVAFNNSTNGNMGIGMSNFMQVIDLYKDVTSQSWAALSTVFTSFDGISVDSTARETRGLPDSDAWGRYAKLNGTYATGVLYVGAIHILSSTINLSNAIFSIQWFIVDPVTWNTNGVKVIFIDNVGSYKGYHIGDYRDMLSGIAVTSHISCGSGTEWVSSGAIDWTNITKIAYLQDRINPDAYGFLGIKGAFYYKSTNTITGGSVGSPINFVNLNRLYNGLCYSQKVNLNSGSQAQLVMKQPVTFGDGTTKTILNFQGASIEIPLPYGEINSFWNVADGAMGLIIYAGASDVYDFRYCVLKAGTKSFFIIHNSFNLLATFYPPVAFIGFLIIWKTGLALADTTLSKCYEMDAKAATITNCIISNPIGGSAMKIDDGAEILSCQFSTATSADYAIRIPAAGSYDLSNTTFTGFTKDIHVTAVTGTVTITLALGQSVPTYITEGATVTFIQPVNTIGLAFTGLLAGSQVIVYLHSDSSELFRTENSGTTETYSVQENSKTLDYTILKKGYNPIRVSNLTVTSLQTTPINQVFDRADQTASGLTYGSTFTVNLLTKKLNITVASTIQNVYSYLKDCFIAQSALKNITFFMSNSGEDSFDLLDGWEWYDTTAKGYLKEDGMRYINSSGAVTAIFCAVKTLYSDPANVNGKQAKIQQVEAASPVNANNTGGINQMIQIWGDATHGNYDKRNYLALKYQINGYLQAYYELKTGLGLSELSDKFYTPPLEPLPIAGFTLGNPGVMGLTITDHGEAPLQIDIGNGTKNYSISIMDTNNNSAENIHRWLNWNIAQSATFQSDYPFNWGEMVIFTGTDYETCRSLHIGSAGEPLKGVIILRTGNIPHPGFSKFQSDDESYGIPPSLAIGSITGLVSGSGVLIYNETTDEVMLNEIVNATYYNVNYEDGTGYTAGDVISFKITYVDGATAKEEFSAATTATSSGWSILVSQVDHTNYNLAGIAGEDCALINGGECSWDGDNIQVDIDDPDGIESGMRICAFLVWYSHQPNGRLKTFGCLNWFQVNKATIDQDICDLQLDNVSSSAKTLRITDMYLTRKDGSFIISEDTHYSIAIEPPDVFDIETGVSGLTNAESSKLLSLTNTDLTTTNGKIDAVKIDTAAISINQIKLDTTIEGVSISQIGSLLMGMVDGNYIIDPDTGDMTIYKRDNATPLTKVNADETSRTREAV